ncbi:hypothetical protein BH10PSE9_BH10PSE9_01590 [soil metagenome]
MRVRCVSGRPSRPANWDKPSLEVIGVDGWFDAAGMQELYADPAEMEPLSGLFTTAPEL